MSTLLKDIQYAFRMLLQKPAFTIVAVLTLGLAIGASSAMFSVVNAVLLRPLNFDDAGEVLIVWESNPDAGFDIFSASPANFYDWHRLNTAFESMAAYARNPFTLTGSETAERIPGAVVSGDYFKLVRTAAFLGRTLLPEDALKGKENVVVLSHGLWSRRFGAQASVLGRSLTLNGKPYTVVGVMPQSFMYPSDTDVWVPFPIDPVDTRGGHFLNALARLKDGSTIESASAEMKTIASQLEREYPDSNAGWTVRLSNLHQDVVGNIREALLILLAAVGFVLLIACANVANLQIARGADRSKEIAVRTALGASRSRVIRQLLTESVMLSLAGGALGFVLASAALDVFIALAPANLPRLRETSIDNTVLAFTFGVSLLAGILFGLFPAFQSLRTNLNDSLKESARGSTGGFERNRLRQALVVAEVALTLVIVIGAGLMLQSLQRLQSVQPGFNPENILTMRLNLPDAKYPEGARQQTFIRNLLERVKGLPGVRSASTTSVLPLSGSNFSISFEIAGRPTPEPAREPSGQLRFVSAGYFQTMEMPIARGRGFVEEDTATSQPVAVINESLARQFFPGEDPIGKVIDPGYGSDGGPDQFQIVGIVRDIKHFNLRVAPRAEYYLPVSQSAYGGVTLAVKTAVEPASLADALRREVRSIDPDLAVFNVLTMEQVLGTSISDARLNTALLGAFGFVALLLASIGVYGVMAYSVSQRTHEFGIRMALGARQSEVRRMVLRQGLSLVTIGLIAGIAGALVLTRFMAGMVFEVSLTDPPTFIVVSLLLIAVALLASYIPARRATRVDPMIALRYE